MESVRRLVANLVSEFQRALQDGPNEESVNDEFSTIGIDITREQLCHAHSLGPSSCLYALNLGEDNSTVLG